MAHLKTIQPAISLCSRFSNGTGNFVGDTWHQNVEDAKHQAEFEFDGMISHWVDLPRDVTDVVEFALREYLF
jgi:hypothetical protein